MGTKSHPTLPTIYTIRRQKVVLDSDLAQLYGVPTKRLNEALARNAKRFPADFCFRITWQEFANLRSQIATLEVPSDANLERAAQGKHRKYLPRAFTEHGALMAANILRSEKAVQMSVYLIRAFVEMRETLLANVTILKRLAEIDRRLVEHDSVLREVIDRLQPLLDAPEVDEEPKEKIGFHRGNR